jgi:hypothetical protein
MLSSTLSLDEEEAVQEELRQLQAETVSALYILVHSANSGLDDVQLSASEDHLSLPSAPTSEPILEVPEGEKRTFLLLPSFLYSS